MRIVSIICGLALLITLVFFAGMWTTHKRWAPWRVVDELLPSVRSYRDTGVFLPDKAHRPISPHSSKLRYQRAANGQMTGHLFLVRMAWPTLPAVAELLDLDGNVVFSWPIAHDKIFDGGDAYPMPHGVQPLPDGSILVNFDGSGGLARLDSCGTPIWAKNDFHYHHSIHLDDIGGFWTWTGLDTAFGHNQRMDRFDIETGAILESINLIDDVMNHPSLNLLDYGLPMGFEFYRGEGMPAGIKDIFHPNDVEPLSTEMAAAFPEFSAGDLLVSLRNNHTVAVIDRETHATLWTQTGPWSQQHDPDFQPDGTISVFANNRDRDFSRIISVNPTTGAMAETFDGGGAPFYSDIMGKHERLANGNWLIISAKEGRVFETDPSGQEVLREFVNFVSEDFTTILSTATIVPLDYFDAPLTCAQ